MPVESNRYFAVDAVEECGTTTKSRGCITDYTEVGHTMCAAIRANEIRAVCATGGTGTGNGHVERGCCSTHSVSDSEVGIGKCIASVNVINIIVKNSCCTG